MIRKLLARLAAVAAAAALIAMPGAAQAHTASSYFTNGIWPDNTAITYAFQSGYPGGEYRTRVGDAAAQWNNAASTNEPTLYAGSDGNWGTFANPCGVPGIDRIAIFAVDLDVYSSTMIGATKLCSDIGGEIFTATVAEDNETSWYTGTGDASSSQIDYWSNSTHELGHALGFWEHIAESDSACPDDSTRSTMCPTLYPGTERQRTVATHDIHTFDAAY